MAARKQINRYKTDPYGHDYKEVLQKGKQQNTIGTYHDTFEMQPHNGSWMATSVTLPTFVAPKGTITVSWDVDTKRWIETLK